MMTSEYMIERTLGKGSFGSVCLARNRFGNPVALKTINKKCGQTLLEVEYERASMLALQGYSHIPSLYEAFEDENNWYFVMEYVEGQVLFNMVIHNQSNRLNFSVPFVKDLFAQMAEAVKFIHSKGIAHLDIKLENFMISSYQEGHMDDGSEGFDSDLQQPEQQLLTCPLVKLIDFGLCEMVPDVSTLSLPYCRKWVGSPDYMCPEILLKRKYRPDKADVFSLGVILYILIFCEIPFVRNERNMMVKEGRHPTVRFPANKKASKKVKDLLEKMLAINQEDRIGMDEVLEHPWMVKEMEGGNDSFVVPPSVGSRRTF